MKPTTNNLVLDESLVRVRKALRRLVASPTDNPRKRKNARRVALGALRLLRAAMDREFPAIIVKGEVKRRTPDQRIAALKKAGWVQVERIAPVYALVKIPVKRVGWTVKRTIPSESVYVQRKGWVTPKPQVTKTKHEAFFIPAWVAAVGLDINEIRAAKRSWMAQRAALSAQAMAAPPG